MNEENLCTSFNGLLDDGNEGWVITKNEHGKLKIASCPLDDTNMYEKTREWIVLDVDETKTFTLKLPICESSKIVNIFIRDLLNAEWENGYFTFKNICFLQVHISGTVVDCYERDQKLFVTVDDSTSTIKCIIEKAKLPVADDEIEIPAVSANQTNVISSVVAIIKAANRFLENSVPSRSHDLVLGDIVNVTGTLAEYKDNRYIFIDRIIKEQTGSIRHCLYLEELIDLYTNTY